MINYHPGYILTKFERHETVARADNAEAFGTFACGFLHQAFGRTVTVSLEKQEGKEAVSFTFVESEPLLIQRICSIALFILTLPISLPLVIAGVIALYCSTSYAGLFQAVFNSTTSEKDMPPDFSESAGAGMEAASRIDEVKRAFRDICLTDILSSEITAAWQLLNWINKNMEICLQMTQADLTNFKDITSDDLLYFFDMCPNLSHVSIQSDSLDVLHRLPEGLKTLELYRCKRLRELLNLPQGLQTLLCSHCDKLHSLPVLLPASLQILRLRNCPNLQPIPSLKTKSH